MNPWLEKAIADADKVSDGLLAKRQASLALLKETPWPGRKVEAWKYTPVRGVERSAFEAKNAEIAAEKIADLPTVDLLFCNGFLKTDVAQLELPEGLSIRDFSDDNVRNETWVNGLFSATKPSHHVFGLVNDTLAINGVVIDVAPNAKIDQPIRIVRAMTEDAEAHLRILVRVGKNASASIIEQTQGDLTSFATNVSEFEIHKEAKLEHNYLALQSGKSMAVSGCHFRLHEKSELNSTVIGFGSELARIDVDILHAGEQAHAKMNAVYLLAENELFDLHSNVEHQVPNCTTDETVRGIVGANAKAVFNGRIHIHRDAQKTLAELNNKNLLLSDTAQVNTKPELEIYADDVRCAHGATVAELDKTALYYLTSRGIDKSKALVMLNYGFINALIDEMPNQALADWLRPKLQERFSTMETL